MNETLAVTGERNYGVAATGERNYGVAATGERNYGVAVTGEELYIICLLCGVPALELVPLHQTEVGLVCWSLTSLCHSNGHIETMPAREINPFTAPTRIRRSQFLRTQ